MPFFSRLFLLLSQQSDCPAAAGYVTVFRAGDPDSDTNVRLRPGWWREHEVRTQSVWSAADYRGELLQQLHVALMSPRHVGLLLWKSQAEGSPPEFTSCFWPSRNLYLLIYNNRSIVSVAYQTEMSRQQRHLMDWFWSVSQKTFFILSDFILVMVVFKVKHWSQWSAEFCGGLMLLKSKEMH